MHFQAKNTLKNNRYHNTKYALRHLLVICNLILVKFHIELEKILI
jgi:hypothetical protein